MRFDRLHRVVTFLLSGLGMLALGLGGGLSVPWLYALVWAGAAFLPPAIVEHPKAPRWLLLGLLVALGWTVYRVLGGTSAIHLAAIEFAVILQLSRLAGRRSARDDQQIALLAFMHLAAATVLTSELSFGVTLVCFGVVAPWMLSLSHLRREMEANYAPVHGGAGLDLGRVLASRRIVGPRFLLGTTALALPVFAIMGGTFLLFPRVGLGFLSFGQRPGNTAVGFGSQVQLGQVGTLRDDPTIVMRVRPPAEHRPTASLPMRFRGTSFEHYDGRTWSRRIAGRSEAPRDRRSGAIIVARAPTSMDQVWDIALEHLDEPVLFVPSGTTGLRVRPDVHSALRAERPVFQSEGGELRYLQKDDLGLRYDAFVARHPTWPTEDLSAAVRAEYLEVPGNHERLVAEAARVVGDADDASQKVRRLMQYLRDSGRFRYSRSMPEVAPERPVEDFVVRVRQGHCEYFSTALAVMLRAVGVPARNVTGFLGGEYNRFGKYYAVRQAHAHSWVEAYLDEASGWMVLDPTPASGASQAIASSEWMQWIDAMRAQWQRNVVGYDLEKQMELARRLRERLRGDRPGSAVSWIQKVSEYGPGVAAGLLAVGAVGVAWFAWRRRPARRSTTLAQRHAAATRLLAQLQQRLAVDGIHRAASEPPRVLCERAQTHPSRALVCEVVQLHEEAVYGGCVPEAAQIERLRRAMRSDWQRLADARSPS